MGLDRVFSFGDILVDPFDFSLSIRFIFLSITNYIRISTIDFVHGFDLLSFVFTNS